MMTDAPTLTRVPLAALVENPRNTRTHSEQQIEKIAASIRAFGFNAPILINADNLIVAGHGRLAAARLLGLEEVPCLVLAHMSEAQQRAYAIADNRIPLDAAWDWARLTAEVQEIDAMSDIDMATLGFSDEDWELLQKHDAQREENSTSPQLGALEYRVVIDCTSEEHQAQLLEQLEAEGLQCRALIS